MKKSVRRVAHALAAVALVCLATGVRADVRALSDAEREAVQISAAYLASGPDAVIQNLASSSPLRALPASEQAAEIAARLGPAKGTIWKLITVVPALKDKLAAFDVTYASGIDDTIFFDLVQEGGRYRVRDIRMTAMPAPLPAGYPQPEAKVVTTSPVDEQIAKKFDWIAGIAGVIAAVLAAIVVFNMPARPAASRALFLLAVIIGAGAVFLAYAKGQRLRVTEAEAPQKKNVVERERVGELLALRNAIAAGENGVVVGTGAGSRSSSLTADVGRLWRTQWDFRQGNLEKAAKGLAAFPSPSRTPLVEILRARLALAKNDDRSAAVAYERAVNLGPGRDSLWLEAAAALRVSGFDEQARHDLRRVIELGSREAWIYYTVAALANENDAFDLVLRRAWTLQPLERADLVAGGFLWTQMRQRGPAMINLSEPHEPAVQSPLVSTRAIVLPPAATPLVSGELLYVGIGDAHLLVPNGACLAPPGVRAVDAGEWARRDEERALRDAQVLLTTPIGINGFMQPALRDRIVEASSTLGKKNRWYDVVSLTQSIDTKNEFVPPELFFLRARALQHVARDLEAKALLVELAASPVVARKKDVSVLEGLGDMLASYDMYPQAISAFERAKAITADGYSEMRLGQITMDQRLATKYGVFRSTHFEIRYPPDVSPVAATSIARVLEGELARLQKWIPVSSFRLVIVNIVWWQDFKSIYTGSENILGFYNGKITLPLAGVPTLAPPIVALITHELSHAMLAQATRDQAPRWLQEGLAQRMEMRPYSANAFNMYEDDKLLAVSVLDAVLASSRDEDMVGEAYIVSENFVRYLQENLGPSRMQALMGKFGEGATTEEAIAAVSGRSLAECDSGFRTWGKAEKRLFENPIPVRYDEQPDILTPQPSRDRGSLGAGTFYPLKRGGQQ